MIARSRGIGGRRAGAQRQCSDGDTYGAEVPLGSVVDIGHGGLPSFGEVSRKRLALAYRPNAFSLVRPGRARCRTRTYTTNQALAAWRQRSRFIAFIVMTVSPRWFRTS